MTFTDLRTEIMDRLNLSSTEASTRIGRAINRKYRLITSSIGMQLSRRVTVTKAVTIASASVTILNCEKVINVVNRNLTPYKFLDEVTIDENEKDAPFVSSDSPTRYTIQSHTSNTVTIRLNRTPLTAFVLYLDVHQAVADLSGSNEPAFPESFHDIIIEGVLSDELRKMEKPALANMSQMEFERILSNLRMWIAKNNYLDVYQGKNLASSWGTSGGGASSSASTNADLLDSFDSTHFTPNVVTTTATGSQVNFNPGMVAGPMLIRCNNATALTIDGLVATLSYEGQLLYIVSEGAGQVSLVSSASSAATATNQFVNFFNLAGSDYTNLSPGKGTAVYRYTNSKWRMIAHEQGAWIAYTPTFNGVIGNGTVTGRYRLSGVTMSYTISLVFGNTTTIGSVLSIPYATAARHNGPALLFDTSLSARWGGITTRNSATQINVSYTGSGANISAAVPFVWTTGDEIEISGNYELS